MLKFIPSLLLALAVGCVSNDLQKPFDCTTVAISLTVEASNNTSTCGATDGSIHVRASNGEGPYTYSINGGSFSSNSVFSNLATGTYTIVARDINGCEGTLLPSPTITNPGSTLAVSVQSESDKSCLTENGILTIIASGGVPPYTFNLNNGSFGSTSTFSNLAPSTYTVTVRDNEGCTFSASATVSRGDTGVSWSSEIQNIISSNCAVSGCHNGSQSPNLSTLANVQSQKTNVKARTTSKSMPPSGRTPLSDEQIKKIACWVDDGAKNN